MTRLQTNEDGEEAKVLGMAWNKENDQLNFVSPEWGSIPLTRRGLLSAVSRVWDPLGMVTPLMVWLKTTLQDFSCQQIGWDDPLEEVDVEEWTRRLEEVKEASKIGIDRDIGPVEDTSTLHGFCDASDIAYGAVFWLQSTRGICFIAAKTLVAPKNVNTIPRLELLAVQLATRLARSIRKSLGDVKTCIWSDSEVALRWVNLGAKGHKAFIAARLQEIRSNVDGTNITFRHIPGSQNPADPLTKQMLDSGDLKTWLAGPPFLLETEESWPGNQKETFSPKALVEAEKEKKKTKTRKPKRKAVRIKPGTEQISIHRLRQDDFTPIEVIANECKSWDQLVDRVKEEPKTGKVSYEEVEAKIFATAQKNLDKTRLFEDTRKVLRRKGRLGNSPFDENMRNPVVLDGASPIATLLLQKNT